MRQINRLRLIKKWLLNDQYFLNGQYVDTLNLLSPLINYWFKLDIDGLDKNAVLKNYRFYDKEVLEMKLTEDEIQEVLKALINCVGEIHLEKTERHFGLKTIQNMNTTLHKYLDKVNE